MERRNGYGRLRTLIAGVLMAAVAVGAVALAAAPAGSAPDTGSRHTVTLAGVVPPGW